MILNLAKTGGGGVGERPAVSCEEGNEPSGCVRVTKYLDEPWICCTIQRVMSDPLEDIHGGYCVLLIGFKPLNAELNPICHFLALLGAHHILHVSRIRVKRRVKSHLPSADIIRSSPYSPP